MWSSSRKGELGLALLSHVCFLADTYSAAAIHSFPLSLDPSSPSPTISTLPLDFPVLDFTMIPSSPSPQILVSLDTTWGVLKQNAPPGSQNTLLVPPSITSECQAKMQAIFATAELSSGGLGLLPEHPVAATLQAASETASASAVSKLQLYPSLPLLPRWAGMEEDDELAGPSTSAPGKGQFEKVETPGDSGAELVLDAEGEEKRTYTREELSQMGNKMLGRLRSQGVEVEEFLKKRTRQPKESRKKQKTGLLAAGVQADLDADELEEQMNAA